MPPTMPHGSKHMTAQPSRPVARYRPGKAVHQESSDEEDEEEEEKQKSTARRQPQAKTDSRPQARRQAPEEDEDDDEEGFVTDPEDEDDDSGVAISTFRAQPPNSKGSVPPTQAPISGGQDPSEEDESEAGSSEEDEEEDSAEESSSDEEPRRKFQRPTFVKKSDRDAQPIPNGASPTPTPLTAATTHSPSETTTDRARRIAETDTLIAARINLDNAARAAGRRAWDDDDNLDPADAIDDTDGLDPLAEHAAWRLRELTRLKRDREALITREKEIEELERRRNLTEQEREAEDSEYLAAQRNDREENRKEASYLSKYHHKGAFFQDSEVAEQLKKRDLIGVKFADEVDKSTLPEFMQIRDMNKLGKKGRTRYRDLKSEDTGRYGDEVKRWKGAMGAATGAGGGAGERSQFDTRGLDERFLPDDHKGRGGPTASGANMAPVAPRRDRERNSWSRSRSPRRDDRQDSYRPRRRSYSRSRSRSRSRTPPRRKRSPPPYKGRDGDRERSSDRDKRRRIDAY